MIKFEQINKSEIGTFSERYYQMVTAPIDDMWEIGIIGASNYYKIIDDNIPVGYFCLNDENQLLQFFVIESHLSREKYIFEHLISTKNINLAFASTIEPRYLSLCLDYQINSKVNTYLYADNLTVDIPAPFENIESRLATEDDQIQILSFSKNDAGLEGDWLESYYKSILLKKELILYSLKNIIIGIGEIRTTDNQPKNAHLGVIVSLAYRRKNLGAYILSNLKKLAYQKNLTPICSTTVINIGSQKVIQKAGFIPYHRILEFSFGPE
jgi:hypothetical protein